MLVGEKTLQPGIEYNGIVLASASLTVGLKPSATILAYPKIFVYVNDAADMSDPKPILIPTYTVQVKQL